MNPFHQSSETTDKPAAAQGLAARDAAGTTGALDSSLENAVDVNSLENSNTAIGALDASSDRPEVDPYVARAHASKKRQRLVRFGILGAAVVVALVLVFTLHKGSAKPAVSSQVNEEYGAVSLPLGQISGGGLTNINSAGTVSINGQLNVNNALVLTPTKQPTHPIIGQLYYDQTTNKLSYYNGSSFATILSGGSTVAKIGTATGNVATGSGLSVNGNTLSNSGVLTLQGQAGNVSLTSGGGIAINGTTLSNTGVLSVGGQHGNIGLGNGLQVVSGKLSNSGILSAAAGQNITVTNDGHGGITISGSGGLSSSGGTAGKLAVFTGVQSIADSLISQSGSTITVGGNLNVTGSLALGSPLSVSQGGTGVGSLPTDSVLIGNGTSGISGITGTSGDCLMADASGKPVFQACPGTSVTGTVTAGTITPDALTKFSGSSGEITSTGLTETGSTLSYAGNAVVNAASGFSGNLLDLQVNGSSKLSVNQAGSLVVGGDITASNGTVTAQNFSGNGSSLTNLNGSAIASGTVANSYLTGSGALSVTAGNGLAGGGSVALGGSTSLAVNAGNCITVSVAVAVTDNCVNAATLNGQAGSYYTNASNINAGTIGDSYLSGNVTLQGNTFNGVGELVQLDATTGYLPILNGSSLTNLNGSAIASGTVANTHLVGNGALSVTAGNGLAGGGSVVLGGSTGLSVQAASGGCITVASDGVSVTDSCVNAAELNGNSGSYYTDASHINAGTIGDTYLSTNVTLQGNTFNGIGELVQLDATTGYLPILNGSALTNLNGSAIASGTVANTYLTGGGALSVTAGNGLTGGGSVALGGSTTLNVTYGSSANTAVQGNTTLTCATGTGNLSGGGDAITLGSGGNCSDISITSTPSFSSVTLGDSTAVAGQITLHDGSTANSAVLQLGGTLSGNVNFTLPNGYTGTQTICTIESGNCAGSGSGVTASGTHTQNYLSKFSNSGGTELSNSSIYDNGTGVSIGGTSPVGLFNVGASSQFQVSGSGSVTAVGINSGSGLLQGTGGLTVGGMITFGGLTSSGGQCLTTDASGKLALVTCLSGAGGGSGGVASINGDSGTLTLNNAAATDGSHITIDNAAADGSTKGIATFDANNFSDNGSGLISIVYGSTAGTSVEGNTTIDVSAGTGLTGGSTITLGSGGTATLNVSYGSTANTAAEGNTALTFTGTGNLTGTVSGTAGGGFATNTLALVNNPTFTGLVTANGLNAGSGLIQGAGGLTVSGGDVTLSSLAAGNGSCLVVDNTTHKVGTATCATGSGSSPTFQDVYNNSGSSPLIALNTTGNGLVLQDASTPIGTSLFTVESNDGLTKYFNVTASGASVAGSLSATGTVKLSNLSTGAVLAGSDGTLSSGTINLGSSSYVSGTLGVTNGGTGLSSLATNELLYGSSSSAIGQITNGSAGQCLLANASGAPSFQTCTGAGGVSSINSQNGSLTFNGTANEISVTNTGSTFTFATPQAIGTSSNVTFGTINTATISGGTLSGGSVSGGTLTSSAVNGLSVGATSIQGDGSADLAITAAASGNHNLVLNGSGTGIVVVGSGTASPYTGNVATFTGTVSGTAGTDPNDFTTYSQVQNLVSSGVSGASGNYVQFASGTVQTNSGANSSIFINNTGAGKLIQLQAGGTDKFVVDNTGLVTASNLLLAGGGSIDTSAAGTLNIGKTSGGNATGINLNQNTAIAAGKTFTANGSGFDTAGNLGIGTTAPSAKLDVQGGLPSSSAVNITSSGTATSAIEYSGNSLNINRSITANTTGSTGVQFDTATTANASGNLTKSFTVGNHTNRFLLIEVAKVDAAIPTITYAGTAVPQIGTVGNMYIYALADPAVGINNLVATNTSGQRYNVGISSWYNVDQTNPYSNFTTTTGTGGTASLTLTTTAGQVVVDQFTQYDIGGLSVSPGAGQTSIYNTAAPYEYLASSYLLASSTSLTISESGTANGSHTWIYAALALNPATGGLGPAITGSLADLSSNCTLIGASGCADTSNILNLSQQYAGATGAVLNIQNAGTGDMLDLANGSGTVVAKFDASGNLQTSGTITVGTTPGSTTNVATFNGTVSGTEAQSNGQFTTLGQVNSLISSGVGDAAGNYIANGTSPQTANFNIQGAANSSPVAKIDVGSSTGDILQVGDGSLTGFTVDNAGFNTFYGDTTFDGYALLGTALDSSVAGTAINIGQTTGGNATSINLNQNTIVNGTFQTSGTITATGLLAANGGVTIATGNNFVNGGSTLNSSKVLSLGASGAIGAAATTVDAYTTFDITASASGLSFILPSPTVTTSGRIVYINNVGTNSFTLGSVTVNVGASSSFIWNGTSWTSTAVSTGVSLVGAYSTGDTAANGATISGNTITFQSASATAPGMVDTGTQTFQGSKTFNSTDSGTTFAVQAQGIDLLSVNANGTTSLSGLSVSGAGGYATLQGGADITGSASTGMPALRLALTPAASNTSSLIQVGSAIQGGNGSGTYIGLNAASGYGGDLLNFQVGGVSKFKVDASGNLTNIKGITASGDVSISGNVGIGTTTPSYNLDVQGTAGALTLYQSGNEVCDTSGNCAGSGNGGGVTNAGHQYYLTKTDASGNLVDSQIYDDGTKISIGSTSPGYNLQVNGTIQGTTILQGSNTVCDTSGNCGYNGAGTGAGVASVNTLTGDLTLQGTSQIIVTNTDTSHIGFSIQNDSIDDTQLKYDTGQNLTTSSTPTFAGINLGTASQFTVGNDGSVTTSGLLTANGSITIGSGKNFVNGGSTLNSAKALSLGASGAIGTAAATVDAYTTFNVTATATSLNFSLPSPMVTTAGRLTYISNVGSNSFTIGSVAINSGASASFIWNGTSWTSTAVSTGVSLVGAIDTQTASANGAVINGNSIYLQSASTTAPGLVNTAAQSFKGNKSFTSGITIGDVSSGTASSIDFVQGAGSSALIHLESAGVNGLDATVYLPPIDGSTICVDTGNCDGSTGNGGYIVNSTSPQSGTANFNITGSGTVGKLSVTGTPTASATSSLIQVGTAIQGGNANGTYFGLNAASGYVGDLINLQVNGASKFNIDASGNVNTPGYYKQGGQIVINTTTGTNNVYVGLAGNTTTTGDSNAALGYEALYKNTSGYWNTAMGTYALGQNTTGQFNAAFGMDALVGNTSGRGNVALGYDALGTNTSGWFNTGIGYNAAGAATIQYASAIGANSYVSQSNSIILGCVSGTNSCNTTTKIGIGNTAPTGLFSVGSSSQFQIDINGNAQTSGNITSTVGVIRADEFEPAVNGDSLVIGQSAPNIFLGASAPQTGSTSSLIQIGTNAIQGGNANGTYLGLNAASGYSGDLLNMQVNGASKFEVDASGNLNAGQITVNGGGSWTTISNTGIDYTDTGGTFTISGAAPVVLNSSSFGVASFGQDGLDVQNASNKIVLGVSSTGTITLGDSTSGNYATFTAGGGYTATGTARHIKTISLTAEYAGAVLDASSDTTGTTNCSTNNSGIMASGFDNTNKMNFYEWASSNSSANCYDIVVQIPLPADFDGWASSPGTILSKNSLGTANAVCIEALNALGNIDSNYGGYKCFTPGTGLTSTSLTSFGDTYAAGDTLTLKIRLTSTSNTDITKIGNLQLQYYSKF